MCSVYVNYASIIWICWANIHIYMNNTLTYLYHPVGRCYLLLFYRAVEKHRLRFLVLSQLTLHHANYLICATNCPKGQDRSWKSSLCQLWSRAPMSWLPRSQLTNKGGEDSEQVVRWEDERLRWKSKSGYHSGWQASFLSISCCVADSFAGSYTSCDWSKKGEMRAWRVENNICSSTVLKRRGGEENGISKSRPWSPNLEIRFKW